MSCTVGQKFDLLASARHSGWGAKLSAGALDNLLKDFPLKESNRLLVGFNTSDDAAVYEINAERALISTVDFFPPISHDAYTFGQIAAANALSDVYAMGGTPELALNLFCITQTMPEDTIKAILRGGLDKVYEAGAIICGGHTIYDEVPKYGLAVNGFVHPKKIIRNSTAKEGDILIVTKPLGTGILTTAAKADMVSIEELDQAYAVMAFLNAAARNSMIKYRTHACTDITGFGLLGHAYEMARSSGVSIEIAYEALPIFASVLKNAEMGFIPASAYANRKFIRNDVRFIDTPLAYQDILFDPQTSGGLLISVDKNDAESLYADLSSALAHTVCGKPAMIGRVIPSGGPVIQVMESLQHGA